MRPEPEWLRRKLDRDEKLAQEARAAEAEARRRWQAWCPFCEQDTEHANAGPVGGQPEQNANVTCMKCFRLHAARAKRP